MKDCAVYCSQARRIDTPGLRRGLDEHFPGAGGGLAQRQPKRADRIGIAGRLDAERRVGVELLVGRRCLEHHALERGVELLRKNHRERGVNTLPHFDLRHDQRDQSRSVMRMKALRGITAGTDAGARRERGQQLNPNRSPRRGDTDLQEFASRWRRC